ncbi:hypothetical protein CDAR_295941 [Caerostris darwini]|uniref:Uncharacterized protein n=1 Tax=Caerostris darwini TaxID=1538125 RepID=A0AAV4SUU3_9ARAC|nr:hypothetical protein CDAR_295941 [Caerostris darwini]
MVGDGLPPPGPLQEVIDDLEPLSAGRILLPVLPARPAVNQAHVRTGPGISPLFIVFATFASRIEASTQVEKLDEGDSDLALAGPLTTGHE